MIDLLVFGMKKSYNEISFYRLDGKAAEGGMRSDNRKRELIDATMQIVAENGLNGFSMKKVTERAGVSEALVYRYFPTKDELLYASFESVNKRIAALFDSFVLPAFDSPQAVESAVRSLWLMYFDFLVKAKHCTVFYFDYRDSNYIRRIKANEREVGETYFRSFSKLIAVFNERFGIFERMSSDHLWTYILDTTGLFAKRLIRGELPSTPESYETIWRLIFGGISDLVRR